MSCNSDAVSVTSTAGERSTPPRVDEGAVVVEERGGPSSEPPPPPTPPKGGRGEGGIFLSEEEETGQNGQSHILHFIDNKACVDNITSRNTMKNTKYKSALAHRPDIHFWYSV